MQNLHLFVEFVFPKCYNTLCIALKFKSEKQVTDFLRLSFPLRFCTGKNRKINDERIPPRQRDVALRGRFIYG